MNNKLQSYLNSLQNKKIAVVGLGISNQPLLEILTSANLKVGAFDKMSADSEKAKKLKNKFAAAGDQIEFVLGDHYLDQLRNYDVIFRTPAFMPWHPVLLDEKSRGALITSEMELFFACCPAKIFAVTGSDGKSTTTSIIYAMLREQGYKTFIGGNIGQPLLAQLAEIDEQSMVVLELSSFQLIDLAYSPHVAVLTNVSPNHLNVHRDFSEYVNAKKQIYLHQKAEDKVVINGNSPEFAQDWLRIKSRVNWFGKRYDHCRQQVFLRSHDLLGYMEDDQDTFLPICNIADIHLPGTFNYQNILAAMAAVKDYVSLPGMQKAISEFRGLEHRIEFVREINRVKFYNSSIDSSPERSKHSISAFIERNIPLVLIMGGRDKNCNYTNLGKIVASASNKVILCGENEQLIEQQIKKEAHLVGRSYKEMQIVHCPDLEQAVLKAKLLADPGEAVLLSPAGTSFDQFDNFMQRGEMFKKIVNAL